MAAFRAARSQRKRLGERTEPGSPTSSQAPETASEPRAPEDADPAFWINHMWGVWDHLETKPKTSNVQQLHIGVSGLATHREAAAHNPAEFPKFHARLRQIAASRRVEYLAPNEKDAFLRRWTSLLAELAFDRRFAGLQEECSEMFFHSLKEVVDSSDAERAVAKLVHEAVVGGQTASLERKLASASKRVQMIAATARALCFAGSSGYPKQVLSQLVESLYRAAQCRDGPGHIQAAVTAADIAVALGGSHHTEECLRWSLHRVRRMNPRSHIVPTDAEESGRSEPVSPVAMPDSQDVFYGLNVAERAHLAGNAEFRNKALAEARNLARDLAALPVGDCDRVQLLCKIAVVARRCDATYWRECLDNFARNLADRVKGYAQLTAAFAELAEAYVECHAFHEASGLLDNMERFLKDGLAESRGRGAWRDQIHCFARFVLALAKCRELSRCLWFAEASRDLSEKREIQPELLRAVANHDDARRAFAYAVRRNIPQSDAWLRQIEDPSVRAKTLRDLAVLHAQRGDKGWAFRATWAVARSQDREKLLHRVAGAFAERTPPDNDALRQLLPAGANSFGSAYVMLGWWVRANPDCAYEVLEALKRRGIVRFRGPSPRP